jgi:hypothetical protein
MAEDTTSSLPIDDQSLNTLTGLATVLGINVPRKATPAKVKQFLHRHYAERKLSGVSPVQSADGNVVGVKGLLVDLGDNFVADVPISSPEVLLQALQ